MHGTSQTHQNHTTMDGYRRWRSSMVEQLICNQQVAGSSPIASSVENESLGRVPERSKGTDCKSVATGFEGSNPSPSAVARVVETLFAKVAAMKVGDDTKSAGVAQLVELQPSKLDVAGSRPVSRSGAASNRETSRPTDKRQTTRQAKSGKQIAHVAQLAEHVLGKDEVTRSIRVVGSKVKSKETPGSVTGRNDQPPREGQRDG